MPTDADFLRAIVADPDADGPRLVYADWRDECGDSARAEFVRVQCALAALPDEERDYHPLRERETALMARHHGAWFAPIADFLTGGVNGGLGGWVARRLPRLRPRPVGQFRRGFVEELVVDLHAYLQHASALARMTPLRSLGLHSHDSVDPAAGARLADCSELDRLTSLGLHADRLDETAVRQIVHSFRVTGLKELSLGVLGPAAVDALVTAPLLERLERLMVRCDARSSDCPDAIPLLEPRASRNLISLTVTGAGLTSDQLGAVLPLPNLPLLAHLDLSGNPLGDDDFAQIPDRLPTTLTELDIENAGLGDRAAAALATSPAIRNLRRLNLRHNGIGNLGAMTLADSPNLIGSTRLDLRDNPIHRRVQNALRIRLGHHVVV